MNPDYNPAIYGLIVWVPAGALVWVAAAAIVLLGAS